MSKTTFIILGVGFGVMVLAIFLYLFLSGRTSDMVVDNKAPYEDLLYLCNTTTNVCADTRVMRTATAITQIILPSGTMLGVQSSDCSTFETCFAQDINGAFWVVEY